MLQLQNGGAIGINTFIKAELASRFDCLPLSSHQASFGQLGESNAELGFRVHVEAHLVREIVVVPVLVLRLVIFEGEGLPEKVSCSEVQSIAIVRLADLCGQKALVKATELSRNTLGHQEEQIHEAHEVAVVALSTQGLAKGRSIAFGSLVHYHGIGSAGVPQDQGIRIALVVAAHGRLHHVPVQGVPQGPAILPSLLEILHPDIHLTRPSGAISFSSHFL
mmetsp:Transcript_29365/g.36012  ORF Transcript_29365/g.36012 Transcript_29365/m.36012 type:complete len:221 (+) Transcript_29365:209-871(+)